MKQLWLALGLVFALVGCGSKSSNDDTGTETNSTTSYTWSANISSIVTASCSGSTCHSTGGTSPIIVDNQATFVSKATQVKAQLTAGTMPQSPKTIEATDKQKLIDYLNQTTRD